MTGALFYLLFQSWKNSARARLMRLKQVKYLSSAIVGALYFYFYFYRYLMGRGNPKNALAMFPTADWAGLGELIGAAILGLFVFSAWLFPHDRVALVFSEAEVAFLFPAPVSRRTLIQFKLLKSQCRILFTVLLISAFRWRSTPAGLWWIHLGGLWVVFATLNLHLLGASFARTMLLDRGLSHRWRQFLLMALFAALLGSVFIWGYRTIPAPDLRDGSGFAAVAYYLKKAFASGPLPWLLYPFRLVVRPYLAADAAAFFLALLPMLPVLALHYWWVVRSDVSFEEASVEASRKVAQALAGMRANRGRWTVQPKKRRKPPFKLGATGLPSIGFLWKNLIGTAQTLSLRLWLVMAVAATFVGAAFSSRGHTTLPVILGFISGWLLMMFLFAGAQFMRQDFRQDLPMADLLKTYPMRGWEVALGELLAPVSILTGLQWLLIIVTAGLISNFGGTQVPLGLRLSLAFGFAVIAPAYNSLTLVVPNAAVLYFPGWFPSGKAAPQGIEATGQRLIFGVGQMLANVLALVPPAIAFALFFFITRKAAGPYVAIAVAAVPAALVLAVEAGMGIWLLGRIFERLDVSAEPGQA